jgi:predicted acyl esterase
LLLISSRPLDLLPVEIDDYQRVLDWVLEQPWCNARVGSLGMSYDGIVATQLGAGAKGRIQAIAPLFSFAVIHHPLVLR